MAIVKQYGEMEACRIGVNLQADKSLSLKIDGKVTSLVLQLTPMEVSRLVMELTNYVPHRNSDLPTNNVRS